MLKYILAATAALTLAAPSGAQAQDVPSYAVQSADEQIRGRIDSFDGGYNVTVRDERGFIDNVQLHDGTIINPTGITLQPGMVVSILGTDDGPYLAANEIDTPYQFDGGVAYYGGHPWDYYGPSFQLGFFFGNVGWWHGNDFGGGFHYDRGARIYANVHVNDRVVINNGFNRGGGYGYANRNVDGNGYVGGDHVIHPNPGHDRVFTAPQQSTYRNVGAYRTQQPAYRATPATYRAPVAAYRSQAPAYHAVQPQRAAASFRSAGGGDRGGDRRR